MASCADSASPPGRSRWRPACSSPSARSASRTRSPMFRPPTSRSCHRRVPRADDGRSGDRDPPAAQQDRVDSAPRRARADAPAAARGSPRPGLGARARPGPLADPLRVADRRGVRLPERKAASPRWRWVALGAAVSFGRFIAVALFDPAAFYGDDAAVPNPMEDNAVAGVLGGVYSWLSLPLLLGMLGSLVAGAVAIRIRLQRSVGIERLQTMWLAWSATLVPVTLLLCASRFMGVMRDRSALATPLKGAGSMRRASHLL